MAEPQLVLVRHEGAVARVSLNRPEKRNALTTQLCRELTEVFAELEHQDSVRCVVLTGEGPVFCAGQDVGFTLDANVEEWNEYRAWNIRMRERIQKVSKPVVGRVQGHALGGGTWIATSCDLVVASLDADFAMREIHAGVHSGGAHMFTIGRARSMEMNLLGRRVSAEEAERWGLINRAVPAEDLDAAVQDYVAQLVALPPLGVKYTKAAANLQLKLAGTETLLEAGVGYPYLFLTEDNREAKRAILEKRRPIFSGKRPDDALGGLE